MSDQNQTKPSQQGVPTSRLVERIRAQQVGTLATAQPNANPQQSGQNTPAPRFGSRQVPTPPQPARSLPSRPNPFANPPSSANTNTRSWTMQPVNGTVVRFDLRGLGDPFYRLLGAPVNPELGDSRAVTRALEAGGENVVRLQALLDETWEKYALQGALLVYNWNADNWRQIAQPPQPTPQKENESNNSEDFEEDQENKSPAQKPLFTCLRAIDLALVMNILGRSRSQLLIARAPLLFSQQYLNRSVMSDDPRLVTLARATGYIEEL